MSKKNFFSKKQSKKIVNAIQKAEKDTSGEVRVHIDLDTSTDNHFELAKAVFYQLGMDKTKDKNGVLFHVSIKDKNLTIIGDEGIHKEVKQEYWDNLTREVIAFFKEKKFVKGLKHGIQKTGKELKKSFPYLTDDKNELSDEITFS